MSIFGTWPLAGLRRGLQGQVTSSHIGTGLIAPNNYRSIPVKRAGAVFVSKGGGEVPEPRRVRDYRRMCFVWYETDPTPAYIVHI